MEKSQLTQINLTTLPKQKLSSLLFNCDRVDDETEEVSSESSGEGSTNESTKGNSNQNKSDSYPELVKIKTEKQQQKKRRSLQSQVEPVLEREEKDIDEEDDDFNTQKKVPFPKIKMMNDSQEFTENISRNINNRRRRMEDVQINTKLRAQSMDSLPKVLEEQREDEQNKVHNCSKIDYLVDKNEFNDCNSSTPKYKHYAKMPISFEDTIQEDYEQEKEEKKNKKKSFTSSSQINQGHNSPLYKFKVDEVDSQSQKKKKMHHYQEEQPPTIIEEEKQEKDECTGTQKEILNGKTRGKILISSNMKNNSSSKENSKDKIPTSDDDEVNGC